MIDQYKERAIDKLDIHNSRIRDAIFIIGTFISVLGRIVVMLPYSDYIAEYLHYEPNTYRLFVQLLIYLHSLGLDLTLVSASIFAIIISYVYFEFKPERENYIVFLAIAVTPYYLWDIIPIFVLYMLVRVNKTDHKLLLLLLLLLLKELAFWVAIWYLFINLEFKELRKFFFYVFISVVIFISERILLEPVGYFPKTIITPVFVWYPSELFTPPFVIWLFVNFPGVYIPRLIVTGSYLIALSILISKDKADYFLILITGLPVLLFALYWEFQLWAVVFIVIMAHHDKYPELSYDIYIAGRIESNVTGQVDGIQFRGFIEGLDFSSTYKPYRKHSIPPEPECTRYVYNKKNDEHVCTLVGMDCTDPIMSTCNYRKHNPNYIAKKGRTASE